VEAARLSKREKGKGAGEGRKPSLFWVLLRLFGPYYAFLGFFTFLEECVFRIVQPLFMGESK